MKRKLLLTSIIMALASILMTTSCKKSSDDNDGADTLSTDTTKTNVTPDSTIWGHMGEESGMSVMQFISDNGDTICLMRDEETEGSVVLGSIRNNTDRWAVILKGEPTEDGEQAFGTLINVSQLMGTWNNAGNRLSLYADGTAANEKQNYTSWQVTNGRLILTRQSNTEYGSTERQDTISLCFLTDDSLHILTPHHELIKFGK